MFPTDYNAFTLRNPVAPAQPPIPRDFEAHVALGTRHLQENHVAAAELAFTRALAQNPQDPTCLLKRAEARYCLGRFAEAAQDYSQSLALPTARAHAGKACILSRTLGSDAVATARQHVTLARELLQDDYDSWVELADAMVMLEEGASEGAQSKLSILLEREPDNARLWMGLSQWHDAQGDYQQALRAAIRARTLSPSDFASLAACAVAEMRLKQQGWQARCQQAMALLEERSPQGFWTLIAKAEQAVDAPERVTQLLLAATRINPEDLTVNLLLWRAQSKQNVPTRHCLETLLAGRHPQGIFALQAQLELALRQNDLQQARNFATMLCTQAPQADYFALRASLQLIVSPEDHDAIYKDCTQALAWDNGCYLALLTRAKLDLLLGHFPEVIEAMQRCRSLHPNEADPLHLLAEAAMSQKRFSDAEMFWEHYLQDYGVASRHYTDEAYIGRAHARLAQQKYQEACDDVLSVSQHDPQMYAEAQQLRTTIYEHRLLHDQGVLYQASLRDIEDLFEQGRYDEVLTNLNHHIATNARNLYALSLRAETHLKRGFPHLARADAQLAQDIAFENDLYDPRSERVLNTVHTDNTNIFNIVQQIAGGLVRWLRP